MPRPITEGERIVIGVVGDNLSQTIDDHLDDEDVIAQMEDAMRDLRYLLDCIQHDKES